MLFASLWQLGLNWLAVSCRAAGSQLQQRGFSRPLLRDSQVRASRLLYFQTLKDFPDRPVCLFAAPYVPCPHLRSPLAAQYRAFRSLRPSTMAPRKGSNRAAKTNSLRTRKLASFLKDFDREGRGGFPAVAATRGDREVLEGWGASSTDLPAE